MSVIGPRPQLVRDMVFMTPEQRRRHTARTYISLAHAGRLFSGNETGTKWQDRRGRD